MDESISYTWRGAVGDAELEGLHADGFGRAPDPAADWTGPLERHSLGWVTARAGARLVGFVNVAWDFYFDACGFRPTNAGLIAL